jgi:sugar lactone lactonase YvrE
MRFHLLWSLFAGIAAGQTITTFAGNGTAGYSGDMGPANHAQINRVVGLATDSTGNIYMAEENSNVVRKVDTNGNITTIAGTSVSGFTGDGGPATQARLAGPTGVCASSTGDVYVNDLTNRRVRKITAATGIITTVARNGSAVSTGDGGPATSAGLFLPIRCAVDPSGNLFIVDQGAHVIRKVNTSGTIITYAGINNTANFFGDGGPANQAAMNNPTAAFADTSGNLYVTDQSNHRIRKIDTSGTITTVAGNGSHTFAGDGGLAIAASLNFPGETAVDSAGSLFIMDTVNDVVRKVAGGIISTVAGTHGVAGYAGDGGPPLQAQFSNAFALTIDPSGNLYVSDTTNNRVRIITGVALGQTSSCTYTLNPAAQAFPAAGGSGSIAIATQAGCAWSLASGPNWVTGATAGSGTGTLTFQVVANAGAARFATLTIAGQSFSIEQQAVSVPGLTLIGSMAHLAAQENWTTTFTLVNKSSAPSTARLSFFGDALDPTGNGPLILPLTFPQQAAAALPLGALTGGPLLASSFDRTIAANASLIVTTAGPQTPTVQVGSAQLAATDAVDGFAIFHQIPTAQEAVVPMETRSAPSYLLAFDNTSGLVLGVAVENLSAQTAVIPVIIRDDNGTVISSLGATISLGGNGHTAFVLSDATNGFPVTANKRGTIEFASILRLPGRLVCWASVSRRPIMR